MAQIASKKLGPITREVKDLHPLLKAVLPKLPRPLSITSDSYLLCMKACQHEFTDRLLCLHSRNLDSLDLIYFRLRLPERFRFQTEPYSAVPRAVSSSASA